MSLSWLTGGDEEKHSCLSRFRPPHLTAVDSARQPTCAAARGRVRRCVRAHAGTLTLLGVEAVASWEVGDAFALRKGKGQHPSPPD